MTQGPTAGIIGEGAVAVNVTLNLDPEVERDLMARAHARGISVADYIQELVAKEASLPLVTNPRTIHERFDNLSDLLLNSPFAGANLDLERSN